MSFVAVAIGGGALVGAVGSVIAGGKAASATREGAAQASAASLEATRLQIGEQRRQFDKQLQLLMPLIERQYQASDAFADLLGLPPRQGQGGLDRAYEGIQQIKQDTEAAIGGQAGARGDNALVQGVYPPSHDGLGGFGSAPSYNVLNTTTGTRPPVMPMDDGPSVPTWDEYRQGPPPAEIVENIQQEILPPLPRDPYVTGDPYNMLREGDIYGAPDLWYENSLNRLTDRR